MELFPARLVEKTHRLPGAQHSFMKQACSPEAGELRASLQEQFDRLPEIAQARISPLLGSLENRRFFQGFSELLTLDALRGAGWTVRRVHPPQPRFEVARGDQAPILVSVLASLQNLRPGGERVNRLRLRDALTRISATHRFVVLIRRWLPTDLDPEPVRRAVELWLARVADGQWDGRYATYEDEAISLEFSLTGDQTGEGRPALADIIGPFYAHRAMEAIEPRVVRELDSHRHSEHARTPLLVVCTTDARWLINRAYIFDFLYGRPSRTSTGPQGAEWEVEASASGACVFRDPVYRKVAGLVFADRARPDGFAMRALLNPWCEGGLAPLDLGFPAIGCDRAPAPGGAAVLRSFGGLP